MQLSFWTIWRPQVMSIKGKENDKLTIWKFYKSIYPMFNDNQRFTLLKQYFDGEKK